MNTTTFIFGDKIKAFDRFIVPALECLDRKGITPEWIVMSTPKPFVSLYFSVNCQVFHMRWQTINSVLTGDIWNASKKPEDFNLQIIPRELDRITLSTIEDAANR